MNNIGKLIEAKRLEKELSIRSLANICGISHSEVNKIEDGRRINPSPLHLKKIAHALDIDQIHLMTAAGYIDPPNEKTVSNPFKNYGDLDYEELKAVQLFINFIRSQHEA